MNRKVQIVKNLLYSQINQLQPTFVVMKYVQGKASAFLHSKNLFYQAREIFSPEQTQDITAEKLNLYWR